MLTPVVVDFPLRGEWITPNTPGAKVPSHGTDALGERYAYDFVGIDPESGSRRFYRPSPLRYLILGVRLQDCFGWGQPIFSATAGIVVRAEDGLPERNPVHLVRDFPILLKNARAINSNQPPDLRSLSGNFIIIETMGTLSMPMLKPAQSLSPWETKSSRANGWQMLVIRAIRPRHTYTFS